MKWLKMIKDLLILSVTLDLLI